MLFDNLIVIRVLTLVCGWLVVIHTYSLLLSNVSVTLQLTCEAFMSVAPQLFGHETMLN